ncbi:hypothetical protein PP175_10535 [Aneurinibacillus sp. Ricciae_BoGa-3]|uniref:PQQ-dependent sugar dehydrogenase n=1 Tax=Aneurinibacillus sp. Ricciae_BoGa-3 TaxID=3022697 RepID=UPI0023412A6F|nr:hypothetical protein [Aneurinibacillus sp. Ricciae_BoGa-3]WCK56306.1 hypothetical protein PP175_10535 [Aneurinibacillus sp. Ricciae_BoGa-3]
MEKTISKGKKEEALLKGMKRGYWLNQGYELERIVSGLTFPASIVFDDDGEMYVGEAGFSYGPAVEEARILHIRKNGKICKIASGFEGPLTGFAWHQGYFYVVTGSFNGKVYRVSRTGEKEIIIQGLRGGGDHYTSEIVFGPDGKMYFAVGTTTNSAVVGMDNVLNGWVGLKKKYHDVPARDLKLAGQNFESPNLLDKTNPNARAMTGAFRPFGVSCYPGEVAQGQVMANGVIYRANPDGSGLEIVADGMRNVFGLGFLPDGKLYATSNGFDFRGSRPIEGDWDPFYEVNSGWYGWPDFASGLPVTLPYFKPEGNAQPEFILAEHPPIIEQPLIRFKPHSATQKFDYCRNPLFSTINEIFFAQFGSGPPITTDDLEPKGYRIVKANPYTGQVRDFYINFNPGKGGNWPERPLALRFSPSGESLFIVDFGILEATPGTFIPHSDTGAVWRIKRK